MMISEYKSDCVLHVFLRNFPVVVTSHSEEKPDANSGLQGLLGIAPHYSLTLCVIILLFHFTLGTLAPSLILKQSHWF